MSEVNISDESPVAPGRRELGFELDKGRGGRGLSHRFGEVLGRHFLDVLANFGNDCLVPVAIPTTGACESIIGLRFSRAFERYMALCAQNFHGLSHGDSLK